MRIQCASVLLVVAACGAGNPSVPRGHVCDGSTSMRLNMAAGLGGGPLQDGMTVLVDNGSPYLYVDGRCHFWAQSGDLWAETRTGVLTADQASKLEADIHYAEWSSGDFQTQGVSDASADIFYDTSVELSCTAGCDTAPAYLRNLAANVSGIVGPVWRGGTALTGDMRISVVRVDPGSYGFVQHFSWPLSTTLASTILPTGQANQSASGLLFKGADAGLLRVLRGSYAATNDFRVQGVLGVPVDEAGQVYLVYIRDALPFENASGLVRPPAH